MFEMAKWKEKLIALLREKSFRFSLDPPFVLASGRTSHYYFNCKPTYLDPEGKELVGRLMFEAVRGKGIKSIGGMELGSVPISGAASLISQLEGEPISEFIVRKDKKTHGDISAIEGEITQGMKVAVADDVITTGGSTIKAIEAVQAAGGEVILVLVIVDRQEGGRENIQAVVPNAEIISLVTREEVMTEEMKNMVADAGAIKQEG